MWVSRKRFEALEKQVKKNEYHMGIILGMIEKSNTDMKKALAEVKKNLADCIEEIGNAILEEVDKKLKDSGYKDTNICKDIHVPLDTFAGTPEPAKEVV